MEELEHFLMTFISNFKKNISLKKFKTIGNFVQK